MKSVKNKKNKELLEEMQPLFDSVAKMKLQREASDALDWIADELEKVKGDSFFEGRKADNLAKLKEAIKELTK